MKKRNYKTAIFSFVAAALIFFNNPAVLAQTSELKEIKIHTSAVCDECKEKIETALAFEKGVKISTVDLSSSVVTVSYNPKKITPEKIRLAISNAGYDADSIKANAKAYDKLPTCCKKENSKH